MIYCFKTLKTIKDGMMHDELIWHEKRFLIIIANEMHYFSTLFDKELYMFSGRFTVHHRES